jgi:hypothetical protein
VEGEPLGFFREPDDFTRGEVPDSSFSPEGTEPESTGSSSESTDEEFTTAARDGSARGEAALSNF